jgi:hypothetical protein
MNFFSFFVLFFFFHLMVVGLQLGCGLVATKNSIDIILIFFGRWLLDYDWVWASYN